MWSRFKFVLYFLQGQQDTPVLPLTDEQLKQCIQQIKEYYRTYLCQIQTDPLDSDTILDLEDIFTQLVLEKDDKKDSKTKQKVDYSELHKIKNLGFPVRRLLWKEKEVPARPPYALKLRWIGSQEKTLKSSCWFSSYHCVNLKLRL